MSNGNMALEYLSRMFETHETAGIYYTDDNNNKTIMHREIGNYIETVPEDERENVNLNPYFTEGDFKYSAKNPANHIRFLIKKLNDVLPLAIYGFDNENNPESLLAQQEIHPIGHMFVIVDQRYLVDTQMAFIDLQTSKPVFDLENEADQEEVFAIYGDPLTWEFNSSIKNTTPGLNDYFLREAERTFDTGLSMAHG